VLEPSVLDRIPPGRRVSIERATFPEMVADRSLYALHCDEYWVDAGTPATYLQAQLDLIDGRRGEAEPAVHPTAVVADGALVEHAVLMAGAEVEAGAVVRHSVVLPGSRIGRDALVDGSIIGARSHVGASVRLTGLSVVGDDVDLPEGTILDGARVPDEEPS
jgi:mannose-1-phosphate guanylyltransferase